MAKYNTILTCLLALFICASPLHAQEKRYCTAVSPTPVLNTPDFSSVFGGRDGRSVKVDKTGLIREMEFIAFPGTVFEIDAGYDYGGYKILRVRTNDYPYNKKKLYIDSRFVKYEDTRPPDRNKKLPSRRNIIAGLRSMEGYPYMWGGNFCRGIDQMTEFYKPRRKISDKTSRLWKLEGVDCSGLLYQAGGGCTPRNTSSLKTFGENIEISGLTPEKISLVVEPLDLIVMPGHVVIVLDKNTTIESSSDKGVHRTGLTDRLRSLAASGKKFVIRRWHNISP